MGVLFFPSYSTPSSHRYRVPHRDHPNTYLLSNRVIILKSILSPDYVQTYITSNNQWKSIIEYFNIYINWEMGISNSYKIRK